MDSTTRKRVTMGDVAKVAGVSQSTVSLVLNAVEDARIGARTRNRVLKAARQLQYRRIPPNIGNTDHQVVGLLIDELGANWIGSAIIDDLRDMCWERNADVVIACTRGQPEIEDVAVRRLALHAPIGIVYASIFPRRTMVPNALSGMRTVLVNCYDGAEKFPSIMPDFESAIVETVERLVARGHARIALINHESWHTFAQDRMRGYRKALADAGLPFDQAYVCHVDGTPTQGYLNAKALLSHPAPPTAFICANDKMAFGVYDAAREQGLGIGTDLAVVGYDDHEMSQYMHPPLTSIRMPHNEMVRWAVERILDDEDVRFRRERVHGEFVIRGSGLAGDAPSS